MTTAAEAYFGGGTTIVGPTTVRRSGPRVLAVDPSAGGQTITLPDARTLRPGPSRFVLANMSASYSVPVVDHAAGAVVTVAARYAYDLALIDNDTEAGLWAPVQLTTNMQDGPALAATRFPMDIRISDSRNNVDLARLAKQLYPQWTPSLPAAIRLIIDPGVVIGSSSTSTAALYTGWMAAGSTILVLNHGTITGRGGNGGNGGYPSPGILSTSGTAGGPAMRLLVNTAIANYGTVQGGGGGGGGGAAGGSNGGGGGGGGAGYTGGAGGAGNTGGANGEAGYVERGGHGGTANGTAQAGGVGGGPGAAGTAAGGSGGAAGALDQRWSTGSITLTWLRNGTRYGSETTF